MIDFHSHIIFDVDDGAETIENSIKMILEAEKAGYTDIIATPHYMEGCYEVEKDEINKKIQLINTVLQQNNVNVKVHQGNEVYITNNVVNLINEGIVSTMNNSRYVLIETPMGEEPLNLIEVIYNVIENGKIPVIAHPERYEFIQKNPNKLYNLIEQGALFQANIGSIIGLYGKDVKKTVEQLLQNNMIHFIGTDTHRPNSIYTKIDTAIEELAQIVSRKKIRELTYENAQKVLNNEEIEIEEPTEIKTTLFNKLFKK